MLTSPDNETALFMYQKMLLARKIDEKNWLLNRSGEIPFVVSGQGHEGAQAAMGAALDRTKDYVAPYYRDLTLVLSLGMSAKDIFLHYFAKQGDPNSGGKQLSDHYGSRKLRILTHSSPVSTQALHITGALYAAKLDNRPDIVGLCSFGEGSSNQGDIHEAMNFASIHKLPVIFVCENNGLAISTQSAKQYACEKLSDRAKGYGMFGQTVDGMDALESYKVMKKVIDEARNGKGPAFIEFIVKRFTAHSSDDDNKLYLTTEEIVALKLRDPLIELEQKLLANKILTPSLLEKFHKEITKEVDEAVEWARSAPYPLAEEASRYVYYEGKS